MPSASFIETFDDPFVDGATISAPPPPSTPGSASFLDDFFDPFYNGATIESQVPERWPVAIAGHGYVIDLEHYERFPIPVQTDSQVAVTDVGDRTLNPDAGWAESTASWAKGAGQVDRDSAEGTDERFWSSKGVDPFDPDGLQLLNDTRLVFSAGGEARALAVGGYLYVRLDGVVQFTADPSVASPTWTTLALTGSATDLATDGYRVWIATSTAGVRVANRGSASETGQFSTYTAERITYANGRLIGSAGTRLVEVTTSGFTLLKDHPNPDFTWDTIAGGDVAIYAAGHSGSHSEVYKLTLDETTGGLNPPSPATAWVDGEVVNIITSYAARLLIGTDVGLRMGQADGSGNFGYARAVETGPIRCLETEGRFCWFGLSNYDGTSTGLGVADLGFFVEPDVPAYASNLMASAQGDVSSVVTVSGRRYFTVEGSGVWAEYPIKVPSGELLSSWIRWGYAGTKALVSATAAFAPLAGQVVLAVVDEAGNTTGLVTAKAASSISVGPVGLSGLAGAAFRVQMTLARSDPAPTTGPTVRRWQVVALPTPGRMRRIAWPIILKAEVENLRGTVVNYDVAAELSFLESLQATGAIIRAQEGTRSYQAQLEQIRLADGQARRWAVDLSAVEGTYLAVLRVPV